jgi:hypothetical protein
MLPFLPIGYAENNLKIDYVVLETPGKTLPA